MDKILPITFQKIKNESHNAFMSEVEGLLADENMPLQGFEKLIAAFNLAYQAEVMANRVRRKSSVTEVLVKLNEKREELYAGMMYQYESGLRHYDGSRREAAEGISYIMKSIAYIHNTSNIKRNVYISKITTNIRKPKNAAIVETLELSGWLNALDVANETFQTTWQARINEQSTRGNGNVRAAREVTDKAYQDIVNRVHALIILNGVEEYGHFVRLLNIFIAEEKKSIAIREGWKKHKRDELK